MPPRATPGGFPRRTVLRARLGVRPVLVGLLQAAPELADGPAQRRPNARQPLRAEDQEGDREEKDQFRETDVGQHPVPPSSIMSRAAAKNTTKRKPRRGGGVRPGRRGPEEGPRRGGGDVTAACVRCRPTPHRPFCAAWRPTSSPFCRPTPSWPELRPAPPSATSSPARSSSPSPRCWPSRRSGGSGG